MKNNWFPTLVPLAGIGCSLVMTTTCPGQTPTIDSQPQSVTVEYASDVSFSVTASGTIPLSYQWFKNGQPLADFANVAGSTMPVLHLVGIAANDASTNYAVVISNLYGSITSSPVALTILPSLTFADDFTSGTTNWRRLMDSTVMALDATNQGPLGGKSLLATNSAQKMYSDLPARYTCRVVFTFWIYDDGNALAACGQLRGYSGKGYGKYANPGGLRQELIAGKYNSAFSTNGTSGVLQGETLDTTKYQGRVLRGTNAGWFNLDAPGAPSRSVGWHKFEIDRAASGSPGGIVNFYVDDILAKTVSGVEGDSVNCLVLGSIDTGNSVAGNAWFGNIKVETYPGSFDWQTLDTSRRELFPDWMKWREVGTNARVIDGSALTVSSVNGAATNDGLGIWTLNGNAIDAGGMRGYLDYTISAPANDAYRIEIEGREKNYQMPQVELPLIVSVDGETLGRFNLTYGTTSNGLLHCFTPYLQAGAHNIRLYWDNVSLYRKLHVEAVRLQEVAGGAVDPNGMKTWVANRLAAQCGVDYAPETSLISPVCVEGRGQYLSMMNLYAAELGGAFSPIRVHPGAGCRWYANVPLSPSNSTIIEASFQNGGLTQTNQISWVSDNLLYASNIMVRRGDSLLLSAFPEGATSGQMTISVAGGGSYTSDISSPVPYRFDEAGTYTVTGAYLPTGATGTITVDVVDASFEERVVPARALKARYWDCTNLPPEVVMDPDPRLRLVNVPISDRLQQTPALPPPGPNEREFRVRITSAESPQYVLARLGPGGPVLAEAAIQGFRWNIAPDTYLRVVGQNDDGSQLIQTAFVMSPLMPSLTVGAQVIVNGVTFDDGTVSKNLSNADFDGTGTCCLQFIRAAGVNASTCHTTHLYDGNTLIGWQ